MSNLLAEIKPRVATQDIDKTSVYNSSHVTQAIAKKDSASSSIISRTTLEKEGGGKQLGNPGWPSKIENPINVPSVSPVTTKGVYRIYLDKYFKIGIYICKHI